MLEIILKSTKDFMPNRRWFAPSIEAFKYQYDYIIKALDDTVYVDLIIDNVEIPIGAEERKNGCFVFDKPIEYTPYELAFQNRDKVWDAIYKLQNFIKTLKNSIPLITTSITKEVDIVRYVRTTQELVYNGKQIITSDKTEVDYTKITKDEFDRINNLVKLFQDKANELAGEE